MVNSVVNGRNVDILLVEDNPGDVRRIELMLEMVEDSYRLHSVNSVESANQALAGNKIQIILLDLTLPDSNGVQTIRAIRAAYQWVPIVVLTGQMDEQLVAEAASAGAHDYLAKNDLTPANLKRVLRYALERRHHEEQLRTSQTVYYRQARELNLLNRIISAASASNNEQSILDATCYELAQFYNAWRVLIALDQATEPSLIVQAEYCQPERPSRLHGQYAWEGDELFTAVRLTQQTLITPVISPRLKQFLAAPDNSKVIIHPLVLEGENIGFVLLNLHQTYEMAVSDVRLVKMVTEEIELALTKIRLYGRLQAHATELEDRVQERTQELAEANEQLKSLDKLKSKFVSDVSHELRNPITNLTLYLELLEFAKPGKQDKYFNILRNQVRRLSNLVEEILALSRLENNDYGNLFTPIDLNLLIQQIIDTHKPRAKRLDIKLHFEPFDPLPPVWGEPNQLTQIITNLLDNALSYTAKGFVNVSTNIHQNGSGTEVILCVSDSGMGIPVEDLPHIFERFYRGSQIDRDVLIGTGLGLGIVKEIVTSHNGRISVKSTINKGSSFTVTLPSAPQEAQP